MDTNWSITAAGRLRDKLKLAETEIGIIFGTGFGDKLNLENIRSMPCERLREFHDNGFDKLALVTGHERKYIAGEIGGKNVIALSGRIHLNESPGNPDIFRLIRLQVETMLQLGVKKLIITCAAGALPGTHLQIGNLVILDGFVTLYAPQMPLWGGEFFSPEDTLSKRLQKVARKAGENYIGRAFFGGYAMVLGPYFEGRKYDKTALRQTGAKVVGMSVLPEACIAALYPKVEVLGLAFVTNNAEEIHSHEENIKRVKNFAEPLSSFLTEVIKNC